MLRQSVILIADGEHRPSANTDIAFRLVQLRQVKLADLLIQLVNLGALNPERRVLGGLGVDAGNGVILRIDPERSPIQELIVPQRLGLHYVELAAAGGFAAQKGKPIVAGVEGDRVAIGLVGRRLLLGLQEPLQDMANQQLAARLRLYGELLFARRSVLQLHIHFRFDGPETRVFHRILPLTFEIVQLFSTLGVVLHQPLGDHSARKPEVGGTSRHYGGIVGERGQRACHH